MVQNIGLLMTCNEEDCIEDMNEQMEYWNLSEPVVYPFQLHLQNRTICQYALLI